MFNPQTSLASRQWLCLCWLFLAMAFSGSIGVAQDDVRTVVLDSHELNESSGIAQTGPVMWTHNDSGDIPRLFAFSQDGALRGRFLIRGAQAIDWEDMCAFQRDGKHYLAVGDIGDNSAQRKSVRVYVIQVPEALLTVHAALSADLQSNLPSDRRLAAETSIGENASATTETLPTPALPNPAPASSTPLSAAPLSTAPLSTAVHSARSTRSAQGELTVQATFEIRYPTGPVDCEALAYDSLSQSFLLATKELLRCRLYRVPAAILSGTQSVQAEFTESLLLPLVTGGDISPDGKQLVLSTYGPGCLLQRRFDDQQQPAGWETQGLGAVRIFALPPRRQGESIGFSQDGQRLWLTSEGIPTPLHSMPVPGPRSRPDLR